MVRDPIHGFIEYSHSEEHIIDSEIMQRLRRIRQLAFADMVYPGCTHSRFEHSLGTMHLAGKIGENLGLRDEDIRVLRIAGLLHDVGHGPFSHISEKCLEIFSDATTTKGPKTHELITAQFLEQEVQLIDDEILTRIRHVLNENSPNESLLTEIISGPLDVDKMDYLLRDSYYAGVSYGIFDIDHLLRVVREKEDNLVFSESGLHTIEQILLARDSMRTAVYGHKVRLITDAMLVRMVQLAAEDDESIRGLFEFDGSPDFLEKWKQLDDFTLFAMIGASNSERAHYMGRRLRERRLLKRVLRLDLEFSVSDALTRRDLNRAVQNLETQQGLEKIVAETVGVEPWEVIVNPVREGKDSFFDPTAIIILRSEGDTKTLKEMGVVRRQDVREYIDVYISMDDDLERQNRHDELAELEPKVKETLLEANM